MNPSVSSPTVATLARAIRDALTAANVNLRLDPKSKIEGCIAAVLQPCHESLSDSPARALDALVRFAADNQEASSGRFIRDFLRSVHAGGGEVNMRPLHHLDDDLARKLITVQRAFFVTSQPRANRLFAEQIEPLFKAHNAEAFFFASS